MIPSNWSALWHKLDVLCRFHSWNLNVLCEHVSIAVWETFLHQSIVNGSSWEHKRYLIGFPKFCCLRNLSRVIKLGRKLRDRQRHEQACALLLLTFGYFNKKWKQTCRLFHIATINIDQFDTLVVQLVRYIKMKSMKSMKSVVSRLSLYSLSGLAWTCTSGQSKAH